ncbi:ATP phosphoribosyltransferase [Salinisphaera sp. USBA-960]|uniref:ATP phosphoribosyltransferase n=1 Tax=Salinisphaera orenii TaxID=856731 RepID=UPI000DBE0A53|nr:ATP phosphoribosyltransferase [Salifodinibacter halophilus]NNC26774.1 ATP phosphoribosyltransferase [Salifodinibacter halophilus]
MSEQLTLALSKGRILEATLPRLAAAGITPTVDPESSRQLIIGTSRPDLRLLVLRATDVPTFVAYGAADLGVAGKDVLLEHGGRDLYEPLDLGIAGCRMAIAGCPGALAAAQHRPLRVATKFEAIARDHFARRGRQIEIVKLYGSMELAPIVGLADVIVDLVDTGNTLAANGLETFETIQSISARLVVNKAAQKLDNARVRELIAAFEAPDQTVGAP